MSMPTVPTGSPDFPIAADKAGSWLRHVAGAISDGALVLDAAGRIVHLNEAFTDLTGYSLDEGPISPPFPWWPQESECPASRAAIREALDATRSGEDVARDLVIYTADRRRLIVRSSGAGILDDHGVVVARLRIVRDITKEHSALERRQQAAQAASDFAEVDDLGALLNTAQIAFDRLFEGVSVLELRAEGRHLLFTEGGLIAESSVSTSTRGGLGGERNPDTASLRPGILLTSAAQGAPGIRAWVQFARPRRIGADEMVVADLLALVCAAAYHRIIEVEQAADREAQLERAVDSHRTIGQAVGMIIERHRVTPSEAFARLRQASQNNNLKLREVAARLVETGENPEDL